VYDDQNDTKIIDAIGQQESWAVAKMTKPCAVYMGALKIFGVPDYAFGYFSQNFNGLFSNLSYESAYKIWSSWEGYPKKFGQSLDMPLVK